jgi:hypothetical protein
MIHICKYLDGDDPKQKQKAKHQDQRRHKQWNSLKKRGSLQWGRCHGMQSET